MNDKVPLSDPSELTTQQMLREVALSREIIETRINAMAEALKVVQAYPTELDKAVASLQDLLGERFERIEQAMELKVAGVQAQVDKGLESQKVATALALEAVNKAAQISQATADRAVAKAEAAADKLLLESMINALHNNFSGQIQNAKESLQVASAAQKEAVAKAEQATEKRFDAVNEFRAQLADQASRFMPRMEAEAWSRNNAEKIDLLQSRMDRLEGRSGGMAQSWAVLVAVFGMAIGAVGLVIAFT